MSLQNGTLREFRIIAEKNYYVFNLGNNYVKQNKVYKG